MQKAENSINTKPCTSFIIEYLFFTVLPNIETFYHICYVCSKNHIYLTMLRSTEQPTSGALPYGEAVDFIKKNMQVTSSTSSEPTADQTARITLMQEIQELESKIEEVNQLLCRTSLEYMVRFQLKDDLEYYHGLIENKRQKLGA